MALAALEPHPHAAAVLGPAVDGRPSHAYLLHGPAGSGKRAAARAIAGELLARGAADPAGVRLRVEHGTHPDLTWVVPSGAHEMRREDIDEPVIGAAGRTPFEAAYRVFVIERADTMGDPVANALLKTLEEPPAYVVLLLLTDRPSQVLPTIASRCQPVRFDAPSAAELAQRLASHGAAPPQAEAAARLSLGDGERALALAMGDGTALRAHAEAFARAPLHGKPGAPGPLLEVARGRGAAERAAFEARLADELAFLPRKEHKRRENELGEEGRRAERRARTLVLDHGLQLAGLWYRDLLCVAAGAPELVHHADRADELARDAEGRSPATLRAAVALVDDFRARLKVNVTEELACEALGLRLLETFGGPARATAQRAS